MVSTRSLLAATLVLFASVATASPAATRSSTKTSSKTTSHLSTTTSTKSKATSRTTTTTTASTPACSPEAEGILYPTAGTTITQVNDGNYGPTYVEVLYCSGQYFKTSSIDASVWLAFPDTPNSGELLIKSQQPDNLDAYAGYYSYRLNASIVPSDGDYPTGQHTLSVYETATGYYNPYNFQITSVNVSLTVVDS